MAERALETPGLTFCTASWAASRLSRGLSFISTNGSEYDSLSHYSNEQSCQNSLTNLGLVYESRYDFAVMDGNHEAEYLRSEVDVVRRLLTPNGVLLLDDVSEGWADIRRNTRASRPKDGSP